MREVKDPAGNMSLLGIVSRKRESPLVQLRGDKWS